MTLEAGKRLGPYEIVAPLGAGGMGEVYRARDTRLDRQVAVKVLPAALSEDAALRARFEREARAASSLNHPHICTLHDVGREDGVDFLVMEYLEGETLGQRLEKGSLPLNEALDTAIQIADALDTAHRNGLVHRDLKPGNIMLTPKGAKLMDFGLAKGAQAGAGATSLTAAPTVASPLTAQGMIVGTFQYMAPEQLEGKEADARSDIFAFGSVLYEMIGGRRAFAGATQASVIARILETEPPPLATIAPGAPPALDRLIRTCLAKDPDERRQSIHDVLQDLRWIREAGPEAGAASEATASPGQDRRAWSLAAAFALITALLAAALFLRPVPEARTLHTAVVAPPGTDFDFSANFSGAISLSPDGRFLTFTAPDESGERVLWIRALDAPDARPLTGTTGAQFPFWSPDSRQIAFFADGKLKRIDRAGSPPVTICPASEGRSGAWNEDGVILFSPWPTTGIHQVPASGGASTPVTEPDKELGESTHRWATFLPDGHHFLYMAGGHAVGREDEANAIFLEELGSTERTLLVEARSNAVYSAGHLLYVRDRVLMAQPFDPDRGELTGDPIPLASDITYSPGFFRATFAATADGLLAYQAGGSEALPELRWVDRKGEPLGTLGQPADYDNLAVSPDGSQVAYSAVDADAGTNDIWILDVERDIPTRFTFGTGTEDDPVWSPDGTELAFSVFDEGDDIWVKAIASGEEGRLLVGGPGNQWPSDWSRDGKLIVFTWPHEETDGDIWVVPASGDGEPFPFREGPFNELGGKLSPDGRWMLYLSDESGRQEAYVAAFPGPGGRRWQVSRGSVYQAWWRSDGREIIYPARDGSGIYAVSVTPEGSGLRFGNPVKLCTLRNVRAGTIAPDGQRLLLAVLRTPEVQPPIQLVTHWTGLLAER
jgi:Tol biopolymer transport system component